MEDGGIAQHISDRYNVAVVVGGGWSLVLVLFKTH